MTVTTTVSIGYTAFTNNGEARRIYGVGQSETTVSRQPRHASPKFIVVKTKCW